jgi:hypothetical protein
MSERPIARGEILRHKERFALSKIKECGPRFATLYPQIVEDIKSLNSKEIAQKYNVAALFGVTETIAESIVKTALRELIPTDERDKIYGPRLHNARSKSGNQLYEQKRGIWGMTDEERAKVHSPENKSLGGQAIKSRKLGIFGMTDEERTLNLKKAYAARTDNWFGGKIIDGMDEGTFAQHLSDIPEYRISVGKHAGFLDWEKIVTAVNEKFKNNRSRGALRGLLERYTKQKKSARKTDR